MKNCDEMVNSLLERRERYVTEQKRKRQMLTRTITSMCCVCLVALLGFGVWRGNRFHSSPNPAIDDAIYPSIRDTSDVSKGEPANNNKIIVRQIDSLPADKNAIGLFLDDFVEMNKTELNEYYGVNVFPTVPDDMEECEDQRFGIYRRNGGTGEVYWDGVAANYSNEDASRTVTLKVNKDSMSLCGYVLLDTTEEKSIINNVEIAIAQSDDGYYYAQFMYHNIAFRIIVKGLTQEEFVAIISSLTE